MCSVGVGGCKQTELSETVLEPGQKMLRRGGLPGCELSEGSGGYRLRVAWPWSVGKRKAAKKRLRVLWLKAGVNGPQRPGNRGSGGGKEVMSSVGGLLNLRAA